MPDRRDLLTSRGERASDPERPHSVRVTHGPQGIPVDADHLRLEVWSEIGTLADVLVHTPGREVDLMPPSMTSELLFDDIVDGERAREEHERFLSVMRTFNVRVWDSQDLLAQALESDASAVPTLIDEVVRLDGADEDTEDELRKLDSSDLARALVHGILSDPENPDPGHLFRLSPIPNFLFSRDAQVVLGDGVVIGSMTHWARKREPLLARFIFERHPRLAANPIVDDFLEQEDADRGDGSDSRSANRLPSLTFEGGDLLVADRDVVLAGVSERTAERSVDRLVRRLRQSRSFRTLILVPMPRVRSAMHLDTIFTRISESECLVYAPMILEGHAETLSVIAIDLAKHGDGGRLPDDWFGVRRPSLLDALRRAGIDLEPVSCGGTRSYIEQAREQWTDGANSFAVAPGAIFLYARNVRTADELARRGYEVVDTRDLPFEAGRCLHSFDPDRKYAILIAGEELSRARGGPRCMTMPLVRRG